MSDVKSSDADQRGVRDRRVPVNTLSDLQTFCAEVLEEPLTNYIDRWPH